jgi:transcriptional regulator with XRE-family HTH domain
MVEGPPEMEADWPAGELLVCFRRRSQLRQQDFARKLGISPPLVNTWEAGRRRINASQLGDIAEILELSRHDRDRLTYARLPALNPSWLARQPLDKQAGLLLAAFRQQAGVTQEALATAIGVHNRSIINWEKGSSLPTGGSRTRICRYYRKLSDSMPPAKRWFHRREAHHLRERCVQAQEQLITTRHDRDI